MLNKSGLHIWEPIALNKDPYAKNICKNKNCLCIMVKNKETGFYQYIDESGKTVDTQPVCKGLHIPVVDFNAI